MKTRAVSYSQNTTNSVPPPTHSHRRPHTCARKASPRAPRRVRRRRAGLAAFLCSPPGGETKPEPSRARGNKQPRKSTLQVTRVDCTRTRTKQRYLRQTQSFPKRVGSIVLDCPSILKKFHLSYALPTSNDKGIRTLQSRYQRLDSKKQNYFCHPSFPLTSPSLTHTHTRARVRKKKGIFAC